MAIFSTTVLGAGKIIESEKILVYNTESFNTQEMYIKNASLKDSNLINILQKAPTRTNVQEICSTVLELVDGTESKVFQAIKSEASDKPGYLTKFSYIPQGITSNDGFNVIIYLFEENNTLSPLGFSIFSEAQSKRDLVESDTYRIKKDYRVKETSIYLGFNNEINLEVDNVNLLDNIIQYTKTERRDLSGDENWNYTSIRKWKTDNPLLDLSPRYTTTLLGKNQYLFSDTQSFLLDNLGNVNISTKLCLQKNVRIDFDRFNKSQVGFYKGDIVISVWNDQCEYSIFSLQKKNEVGGILSYTNPLEIDGSVIFSSNVYQVPKISENQYIRCFTGKYITVSVDGTDRFFDIELQDGNDSAQNLGWLKESKCIIFNQCSPENEQIELDSYTFNTSSRIKSAIPEITNIDYDLKELEIEGSFVVLARFGDWFILKRPKYDLAIITNMVTTVQILYSELPGLIFVNDQVILLKETTGNYNTKYTVFDSRGKFSTEKTKTYINTYYKKDLLKDYTTYTDGNRIHVLSINSSVNTEDSAIKIQEGALSSFRRNSLPVTLSDFEIIGALYGIIFYRIGNYINYL